MPHECDPPEEARLEGSAYGQGLQCEEYMSPTLEMSCPNSWAYKSNSVLTQYEAF